MAFNNMMSVYVLVALLSSLPLRLIRNNDWPVKRKSQLSYFLVSNHSGERLPERF